MSLVILNLGKNNHKQFWIRIKQLGPKKRDILLKIEKEGNLVSNVEYVLNVWEKLLQTVVSNSL